MGNRTSQITRNTKETQISLTVNLDVLEKVIFLLILVS